MKQSKQRLVLTASLLLTMTQQLLLSQTTGVIIDKESHRPIPYVSIYTKEGETVFGAMSNEHGVFSIGFPFQVLFFSHINYKKIELRKEALGDTIFMTSVSVLLSQVVVSNKQPAWIPRILDKVVKQRNKNYQNTEKQFSYNYESYTLGDSSGYAFKSKGNLLLPKLISNPQYYINAQNNTIKYKDKTAGVDFSNLKRMLYMDFISYFDHKFISNNNFRQNTLFETPNHHLVQLIFNDKKDQATNGYLVVDTVDNVVVEVEHNVGTEYNIKHNTTLYFKAFSSTLGIKYNLWVTKSYSKYSKQGDSYYMAESKYKFSRKSTVKNKKTNAQYFTTIESKVSLNNSSAEIDKKLIPLLKPFDAITIYTKKMQKEEAALNKVPITFEKF
jgi:hypothetical protein